MASTKDYLQFILDTLAGEPLRYRAMMGEFLLYYDEKLIGGVYDNRLLIKITPGALALLPDGIREIPYPGAKEMLLVENMEDGVFLRELFQTIFFLPYVTNTLAVGLVFMILFRKTAYSDGFVNLILNALGFASVDFLSGPYWAKMLVLCLYTVWIVMPFKILILTSSLASVNEQYRNAARIDGTSRSRIFWRITLPMISPSLFYLIITGFIGAFKAYSDAVALFGTDLNAAGMNTLVGFVYDMLYGRSGGYPSYASAAAIFLFAIVLTITCVNLLVSKKHVHYV